MSDKWYNEPNCDWFDEEREHRKILTQRIRSACWVVAGISAFSILGLVGSADLGRISLSQFFVYGLVAMAVLVTSIRVSMNME